MSIVEARFAGGIIEIDTGTLTHCPEQSIVVLDIPGADVILFPHEARNLAAALREAVHKTEKQRPVRRASSVDEQLRELDD